METLWQFRILRYVPDSVRNEPINIGILLCEVGRGIETVHVRLTSNWKRVLCIDPDADVHLLSNLSDEFRQLFATSDKTFAQLGTLLEQQFDNSLQLSGEKATKAADPEAEMNRLMALLVDTVST